MENKVVVPRSGVYLLATVALLSATPGYADVTSELKVLLDLDNNVGTGCTVATAGGPLSGVERVLTATIVTTTTTSTVTALEVRQCTSPPATFGAPAPLSGPYAPPWPVGLGLGDAGSDVVEAYLPLSGVLPGTTIRLAFVASVVGSSEPGDALLTTTGAQGGDPIVIVLPLGESIPTLDEWGLLLLAMLLTGAGVVITLRRPHARLGALAGVVLVTLGLGVAWAAITPDGDPSDWSGLPAIATDPGGDAETDADMVSAYADVEDDTTDTLFLRIDTHFDLVPDAVDDQDYTGTDTQLGVAAPGVLGNDGGDNLTATPQVVASTTQGGTVTLAANGSFTYDPPPGFNGNDTFTYTAGNGSGSDTGTVTITVSEAPAVQSATPANGATDVATTSDVTIAFTVPVDVTGTWFSIVCGSSGTHDPGNSGVSGGPTTWTINPTDFAAGEMCNGTVFASQVTDQDTNDPPDTMAADHLFSFTIDQAPSVTSTVPINGATGVLKSTNVTVNFSENVAFSDSSFTLECPTGSPQAFSSSGSGTSSATLNPTSDVPAGTVCTVIVLAAGIADSDTGDPPDTLATDYAFAFSVPPEAAGDTYAPGVVGNVGIDTANSTGFSILTNDSPSGGVMINLPGAGTTTAGGTVSVAASGTFTYTPPAGYEGADSFTYTITNGAGTSADATVSLTVSGMIWFINNNAVAGNGRLATPFNTLAAFQAVNNGAGNNPAAGDNVFLYESATNYTGPVTLLSNQKLIGQDATASLATIAGVTVPADSFALPAMNLAGSPTTINSSTAGSNAVNLNGAGTGNTVRGMTITTGSSTSIGINGSSFGTLTLAVAGSADVTISGSGPAVSLTTGTLNGAFVSISSSGGANGISLTSIAGSCNLGGGALSGSGGAAFNVNGGTVVLEYGGTIGASAAGSRPVNIVNKTSSGNVDFTGAVSASSSASGVSLDNNDGATITFRGGLSLSTGANTGFNAVNGGTVAVCDESPCNPAATGALVNTITTTTGTALNVANTNIGTNDLELRSVSANGGSVGIVLDTTGSAGGLSVKGDGSTLGSGGTLQSHSQDGVRLRSTRDTALRYMNITSVAATAGATCTVLDASDCSSGVDMVGATDVVLDRVVIDGSGQMGVSGHNVSGFTFTNGEVRNAGDGNDEFGMLFSQLSGTVAVQDSTIRLVEEGGIRLYNSSGTLAMTLRRTTIRENDALSGFGEDGFQLQVEGTATATVLVDDSDLTVLQRDGVDALVQGATGAALNLTVQNSDFTDNAGFGGVTVFAGNTATARVTISGNTFSDTVSTAVNLVSGGDATFDAWVTNNTIEHPSPPATQVGFGIRLSQEEDGDMTALVQGNDVSGTGFDGMRLFSRLGDFPATDGDSGTLHVTVRDNTVAAPLNATFGMDVQVQNTENLLCLAIQDVGAPGNNVVSGNVSSGIRARTLASGVMQVEGLALGAQTAATMAAFLNANNTSAPAATASTTTSFTGVAAGTCRTPAATPTP